MECILYVITSEVKARSVSENKEDDGTICSMNVAIRMYQKLKSCEQKQIHLHKKTEAVNLVV